MPTVHTDAPRVNAIHRLLFALMTLLPGGVPGLAADYYVSPAGQSTAQGTLANPWDLTTALTHAVVRPGDTIWLRGGIYNGSFVSTLQGTEGQPIIVRRYLKERAILRGPASIVTTLTIEGAHTWFWGLEFASLPGLRTVTDNSLIGRGPAITTAQIPGSGVGIKLINLVIHDGALGIGLWKEAVNAEVHGSIIYNNGWDDSVRGHGHGIYAQNRYGTMTISDNIVFNQFSYGIHIYGSPAAFLDNFSVVGNILFNNGILSTSSGLASNLLIGGGAVCKNPVVQENYTYFASNACCGANDVPYEAGCSGATLLRNYFAAPGQLALRWSHSDDIVVVGNTLFGGVEGASAKAFSGNTLLSSAPPNAIFVRANKFEARRGNIAVFNWERKSSVQVNMSILGYSIGQAYTIRNAQNYYGPTINGVYSGILTSIPMTGWTAAAPAGMFSPPSTFPEFGAFVVEAR